MLYALRSAGSRFWGTTARRPYGSYPNFYSYYYVRLPQAMLYEADCTGVIDNRSVTARYIALIFSRQSRSAWDLFEFNPRIVPHTRSAVQMINRHGISSRERLTHNPSTHQIPPASMLVPHPLSRSGCKRKRTLLSLSTKIDPFVPVVLK